MPFRLTGSHRSFRFPSHSVNGKPVKIRRCPATVRGDEDPHQPLRKREGGSKDEPQARRPTEWISTVCLPRGGSSWFSSPALRSSDASPTVPVIPQKATSTRVECCLCCRSVLGLFLFSLCLSPRSGRHIRVLSLLQRQLRRRLLQPQSPRALARRPPIVSHRRPAAPLLLQPQMLRGRLRRPNFPIWSSPPLASLNRLARSEPR